MSEPIRVLIVDDSFLVRAGLKAHLSQSEGIEVVGEADTGVVAIEQVEALGPDVVLMDVRMPNLDGLSATKRITQEHENVKILMLTWSENGQNVMTAIQNGAKGYLVHGQFSTEELAQAVHVVYKGGSMLSPTMTHHLFDVVKSLQNPGPNQPRNIASLTPRELDVLALVRDHYTNRQIADQLGMKEKTVKNYINNIYSKLQVPDRESAILYNFKDDAY